MKMRHHREGGCEIIARRKIRFKFSFAKLQKLGTISANS